MSADGSATRDCSSCSGAKENNPASIASTGSIAGKGLVCKRRGRRRAIGVIAHTYFEARTNAGRSLDFVDDEKANGRRFRVLNVTDDVAHEFLGAIQTHRYQATGWHENSPPSLGIGLPNIGGLRNQALRNKATRCTP
jgi:hypothetical protein